LGWPFPAVHGIVINSVFLVGVTIHVEPIMYLAIGFLVSMLFGLMIVPLVHNRAVR